MRSQKLNITELITTQEILKQAIVRYENAPGFPNAEVLIDQLPSQDLHYLYEQLIKVSTLSQEQSSNLSDMLEIQFNPQFSEDSWDCAICQEKKLDYARGCGFLPEDKRDPSPALPKIGSRRFTVCPISSIDIYVTNQASLAYQLYTQGVLPEAGGVGNQTEWFIKTALLYKRKVSQAEKRAMDDRKNK